MTVRDIRLFGDPVLREVCRDVTDFGPGLARLVQDLIDTCRLPGRAGLAAPQIGVDLRVFSYNVDGEEGYLINPRLAACDGHQDDLEGCLSIPGLYLPTPRAGHTVATGVDLDGQPVTVEGTGCWPGACSTRSIISTGTCSSTGCRTASGARRCGPSAASWARPGRTERPSRWHRGGGGGAGRGGSTGVL